MAARWSVVVCFVLEATRERIAEIAWARGLSKETSTWHVGARQILKSFVFFILNDSKYEFDKHIKKYLGV